MTAHQLYYIDGDGKRWNVSNVAQSSVPGFYTALRSDGRSVQFYSGDLKVEQPVPTNTTTSE